MRSVILLSIAGIIVLTVSIWVNRCEPEHKDMVWVRQSFLDSLRNIAAMPPDTIRDTLKIKGDPIIVVKNVPVPIYVKEDTLQYSDSLKNEDINAWIDLEVKGRLLGLQWGYVPIKTEITTVIEKNVPFPVKYEVKVPTPQSGVFLEVGYGRSFTNKNNMPIFSGELIFLSKKSTIFGFEAGYFRESYFKFNLGLKF